MRLLPVVLLTLVAFSSGFAAEIRGDFFVVNPRIDFTAFLQQATVTNRVREQRRLSETRFIELMRQPGVVILDARSRDKYDLLHVTGAINLPYADISEPSLATTLPDKRQVILIYCNNNFENAPIAFERKFAPASLNISTFITLHTYGYENVYELGPLLDVKTTAIPLIGTKG